ncbi:MAG: hypothetical protein E6R14_10430 [Thermomicrobiales bacterium]|nr:MAG: hypothetical protein E6R14_10430 [Thermomicrobiales bacterium]
MISSWRTLVDANAQYRVGTILAEANADVLWVTDVFPDGTEDDAIDQYARSEGRIVVGHDRRFLSRIQQIPYQFDIPVSTGYGRIMLMGRESAQPDRIQEVLPFLALIHRWALENDQRFLVTVSDNSIRYDDRIIARG